MKTTIESPDRTGVLLKYDDDPVVRLRARAEKAERERDEARGVAWEMAMRLLQSNFYLEMQECVDLALAWAKSEEKP